MEKSTQTNRTDIEYISIYDKPKRGKAGHRVVNTLLKKELNGQDYLQ